MMINYWAVVVSAIAAMIIGSIWWGPLFGKMWMEVNHFDQMSPEQQAAMKKGMAGMYIQQFILSLISAGVFAYILGKFGRTGAVEGIKFGFAFWLGFIFPLQYAGRLWGKQKTTFVLATLGSSLITTLVMGIILGAWRI